jgi:hypothetical protein
MKARAVISLLIIFICNGFLLSQGDYRLTDEQKQWLDKAKRHEKNGWVVFHL